MFLVVAKILHDALLLVKLGLEKVLIALELISQFLIRLGNEFRLIGDSLQECVINLSLDVVLMELSLVVFV